MVALAEMVRSAAIGVTAVYGPAERAITQVVPISAPLSETTLTFFHPRRPLEKVPPKVRTGTVLCAVEALPAKPDPAVTFVIVENARLAAIRILREFFSTPMETGIHATAVIHPAAQIGRNVSVGPYAVIGGTGFGYERNESGALELFPHSGTVVIEDDVDIGSHVTIDRATFEETRICSGVKIDNHAYLAHNVRIGRDTMIMASAVICGSVRIGERCWIAPSATIRDGVSIGNDVTVGIGSLVLADVPDGSVVYGSPARPKD